MGIKNVTAQIPDDLAAKMEKLPDVNWSQVVRNCLQRYCGIRLNANIEALMQKMKVQKEEAYSEGYKAALEWFKGEEIRYEDVNEIFQELSKDKEMWHDSIDWESIAEEGGVFPSWEPKARHFWTMKIEHLLEEPHTISDAFIDGFEVALRELEKES